MSNRVSDTRGEKALGIFLDKYFYPFLQKKIELTDYKRIFSAEQQKSGIDVELINASGNSKNLDEKAQLHYINSPKETFAFEISYYSTEKNDYLDGWFVNDSNKTDFYLLIWIERARTAELNRIVAEDFEQLSVLLVSKRKIKSFIEKLGFSSLRLKAEAAELRENQDNNIKNCSEDIFIYKSVIEYDEKPINLIVPRVVLEELAYMKFLVTKAEVIVL